MITTAKEILKECNYFIRCDYDKTQKSLIFTLSWLDNKESIQWNDDLDAIVNSLNNHIIRCPDYAVHSIIDVFTYMLCKKYHYPLKYIEYYENGNLSSVPLYFSINNENIKEKADKLNTICKDMLVSGLRPEHVELMMNDETYNGFVDVCEFYLNIKINNG